MRVYLEPRRPFHTVFVNPAALIRGEVPSQWKGPAGENLTFQVKFVDGRSEELDKELGELMITKGLAIRKRSNVIMPPSPVRA